MGGEQRVQSLALLSFFGSLRTRPVEGILAAPLVLRTGTAGQGEGVLGSVRRRPDGGISFGGSLAKIDGCGWCRISYLTGSASGLRVFRSIY